MQYRDTLQPLLHQPRRRRLPARDEFVLVLLPTATILAVLGFVEILSEQRLLFSSLASSAFLIYLDPSHDTNSVRTLLLAQLTAAVIGWITWSVRGSNYLSAGAAIVATIPIMIALDAMHHPPSPRR